MKKKGLVWFSCGGEFVSVCFWGENGSCGCVLLRFLHHREDGDVVVALAWSKSLIFLGLS